MNAADVVLVLIGLAIGVSIASCIGLGIAANRQSTRRRRRTYISEKGTVMGNRARKARKRAGVKYTKAQKTATTRWPKEKGLGLISGAEILAAMVIGDLFRKRVR